MFLVAYYPVGHRYRFRSDRQKTAAAATKRRRRANTSAAAFDARLIFIASETLQISKMCEGLNFCFDSNVFVCRENPHLVCGSVCQYIYGQEMYGEPDDPLPHNCDICFARHAALGPNQYQASPSRRAGQEFIL